MLERGSARSAARPSTAARGAAFAYGLIVAIALVQGAYYWPRLPGVIASHFDAAGVPAGYMSKPAFFVVYLVAVVLLTIVFVVVPGRLRSLPQGWLGFTDRGHRLAPARRAASLEELRAWLLVLGVAGVALTVIVMEHVFRANLTPVPRLSGSILWVLGGFVLAVATWLFAFLRRYRRRSAVAR